MKHEKAFPSRFSDHGVFFYHHSGADDPRAARELLRQRAVHRAHPGQLAGAGGGGQWVDRAARSPISRWPHLLCAAADRAGGDATPLPLWGLHGAKCSGRDRRTGGGPGWHLQFLAAHPRPPGAGGRGHVRLRRPRLRSTHGAGGTRHWAGVRLRGRRGYHRRAHLHLLAHPLPIFAPDGSPFDCPQPAVRPIPPALSFPLLSLDGPSPAGHGRHSPLPSGGDTPPLAGEPAVGQVQPGGIRQLRLR